MTDTLEKVEEQVQVQPIAADPFNETSWVNTDIPEKKEDTPIVNEPSKVEQPLVVNEWFKELGFESADEAKAEVPELKKLKGQQPVVEEIKFANDDSKRFFDYLKDGKEDDVLNYLSQKKKLEKYISVDITDDTAADVVKMAMAQKYKDLTPDEVEYKFKKQFSIPKEPVLDVDDEDSVLAHNEWKQKANEVKMDLLIEAKLLKPELEKLKSELVLPDIQGSKKSAVAPSKEDLEKVEKLRTSYLERLTDSMKTFNGFASQYKNEDVDVSAQYTVTDEEKAALKTELETFDVEDFVITRWFNEDGTPNAKQMVEDIYLLRNKEKVFQKLTSETGAKVWDKYAGKAKNISVKGSEPISANATDGKVEMDKMAEFFLRQK